MKFFFDNNLSKHLAKGLSAFGEDVMHLGDQFDEDEVDVVWLEYLGKNRITLITKDERIRRNPLELQKPGETQSRGVFSGWEETRSMQDNPTNSEKLATHKRAGSQNQATLCVSGSTIWNKIR